MRFLLLAALTAACASSSVGNQPDGGNGGADGGGAGDGGGAPDATVGVEICDGIDNDDDQFVDEGGDELCGEIPNATPQCNGFGGCRIGSCAMGFIDVDNQYGNGCECGQEATETFTDACEVAVDLGQVPDTNTVLNVIGNLAPVDDVDYYRFTAIDQPDVSCDSFHVRVQVVDDTDAEFQVEVWRGGCGGAQVCPGSTDFQWYTNYQVPGVPATGQCPCTPNPDPATNNCQDETAEFIVKVMRAPGKPLSCTDYQVEVSNGTYPAP
jgi:hypothetical protein